MEAHICPSDRQLALRARLGTGWSSAAQFTQNRQGVRLGTEEEEHILQVLKRNEQLEKEEKERVAHMLQKLERMKQSCVVQRRNECAFCKQTFGRISNLSVTCADCGRQVCSACSVELPVSDPPKRRSLVDRNWMPVVSAASLHQRVISADGIQSPPAENDTDHSRNKTIGEKRYATRFREASANITQAGQNLLERLKSRRIGQQENGHIMVCKICREARDVWKRSGAWFYKTLPRPQTTSCPCSPRSDTVCSPTELVGQVRSSTEYERDTWVKLQPRRRFSKLNGNESHPQHDKYTDKETGNDELPIRINQQRAPTDPNSTTNVRTSEEQFNVQPSTSDKPHRESPLVSTATYPQMKDSSGILSNAQHNVLTSEYSGEKSAREPPIGSHVVMGTTRSGPITALQFHPAFTTQKTRETSTLTNLASSFGQMNSSKKLANLTGEELSMPIVPVSQSETHTEKPQASNDEARFGMLYFTLYHDTMNRQLHVAIHKAKNLIAMDANGLSDPYVVCQILPSSANSPRPRTSTRPQCLNPVWNEALTFEPFDEKNKHHKTLRFAVLDEDLYGSDWLGEYWLPLSRLTPDRLTDFAVPLGPKKPIGRGQCDLACPSRGKIQLGLRFLEDRRQLCIEVIRCSDLVPMDHNGLSDPFVKLYLRPDKTKKTKQKTQIKKATLFPEFHEQFYYEMRASEAGQRTLEVTVWDFDRGPSNDFIGGLTLGADAKAERRELWLAVFRPPFRRIEAWFQLSSRNEDAVSSTPGVCD